MRDFLAERDPSRNPQFQRRWVDDPLGLPDFQHLGREIVVDVDTELPEQLLVDPVRLRQVMLNLTSNAVKFTECGEIVLRVRALEKEDDSIIVEFEVRDTGIGIDARAFPGLFSAFTQADGSMTRRYGGTGLGLAICSQLVGMMGGTIRVESESGEGSRFYFTLCLGVEGGAAATDDVGRIVAAPATVLVVEHNAMPST